MVVQQGNLRSLSLDCCIGLAAGVLLVTASPLILELKEGESVTIPGTELTVTVSQVRDLTGQGCLGGSWWDGDTGPMRQRVEGAGNQRGSDGNACFTALQTSSSVISCMQFCSPRKQSG